jgi:hypothetical protein
MIGYNGSSLNVTIKLKSIIIFLKMAKHTNKYGKGKGKATLAQACRGPEDSGRLRLPYFMEIGALRWQGRQPYAPATFTPRKYSWSSFQLEAESTPGP